jgi:hypothetical protein
MNSCRNASGDIYEGIVHVVNLPGPGKMSVALHMANLIKGAPVSISSF